MIWIPCGSDFFWGFLLVAVGGFFLPAARVFCLFFWFVFAGAVLPLRLLGLVLVVLAFPWFVGGLLALPLCGAAPTSLCRGKEK
ncbi:hypothetical protein NDK50_30030 [Paraburkholderia bryophila]|uniref:hypothetical protein n=1 Tax=Paraburkholderia bryophila TaxID=420952 RepID=UPI00234B803E|nr:hypothetical protein [Paraburkholderia bryophila]WCM22257.1 hypothetical protein NDK50_30030 [Paraburkholderia bryophila]